MKKISASFITIFFFSCAVLFAAEKNAIQQPFKVTETASAQKPYLAAELNNIENPPIPKAPSALGTTLSLFISLLFVIGVIYVVMIALKYFYVRASIPMRSGGVVKVLAREYIDTKKVIYFIEAADRLLILGSSGDNISTLAEITDRETIEKVRADADEYISRYRMKSEAKFSEELKSSYMKQGKKLVDTGNQVVKNILEKFRKK